MSLVSEEVRRRELATIHEEQARSIAAKMCEIMRADSAALNALIELRVPCNEAIETNSPAMPFIAKNGTRLLGLLGILQAIMPPGWRLVAVCEDDNNDKLIDFSIRRTEEYARKPDSC